jgi:acetylornithine deacetylase/succinyl-diaminopimelate desuccinylase-like protein
VLEGEEEIGSLHLGPVLGRIPQVRDVAVAVISDTRMLGRNAPALTYSVRGELKFEVRVQSARNDLHSGHYGGAVHDPIQALCEMLSSLHDDTGRVAVPGFYEGVRGVDPSERASLARFAPSDLEFERMAGTDQPWGDSRFSLFERATLRPALVINGIAGGYAGPGHKAVLPARAVAKLSARLVPDQRPAAVERALRRHFARVTPPTVRASFVCHAGAAPVRIDPRHPMMRLAAEAYRDGFGVPPVMLPSGGTIPVVSMLKEQFGIPTVLMGYALPDDQPHAPNEKFELDTFFKGIATSAHFLKRMGAARTRLNVVHAVSTAP